MENSKLSSIGGAFKSTKVRFAASKSSPLKQTAGGSDPNLWSSKTPEKPAQRPHRVQTRRSAMSIKEVREVAKQLQKPGPDRPLRPDPLISAREQIELWPIETPVAAKPKKVNVSDKLPEKHEILAKFFDSLDSSVRLLRLKGHTTTFTNICPKIECLTDRRFSYGNLAQLKFILPEAIELKKVLVHDERTSCMKPDLQVTLNAAAIENDVKLKKDSGYSNMRKLFRVRLMDFYKAHPEGDEVPEGTLPEPFNSSKQDLPPPRTSTIQTPPSHLSQSFKRRFSLNVSGQVAIKVNQDTPMISTQQIVPSDSQSLYDQGSSKEDISAPVVPSPIKISSKAMASKDCLAYEDPRAAAIKATINFAEIENSSMGTDIALLTPVKITSTPAKLVSATPELQTPIKGTNFDDIENSYSMGTDMALSTPVKSTLTPVKLMSATPGLRTPKRCLQSPDAESASSASKLVRRPPRSRSLKFDTPVKNIDRAELNETGPPRIRSLKFDTPVKNRDRAELNETGPSTDSDLLDILPDNLLQSIREKERKAIEENDPAISQAKKRRQMIASLPKLFDTIHFFFQSINRSIITKQELMHRIITSRVDIADKREIEEQLKLLQELVPDWIHEKLAISGDLLLCINKITSPDSIRSRLAEAC